MVEVTNVKKGAISGVDLENRILRGPGFLGINGFYEEADKNPESFSIILVQVDKSSIKQEVYQEVMAGIGASLGQRRRYEDGADIELKERGFYIVIAKTPSGGVKYAIPLARRIAREIVKYRGGEAGATMSVFHYQKGGIGAMEDIVGKASDLKPLKEGHFNILYKENGNNVVVITEPIEKPELKKEDIGKVIEGLVYAIRNRDNKTSTKSGIDEMVLAHTLNIDEFRNFIDFVLKDISTDHGYEEYLCEINVRAIKSTLHSDPIYYIRDKMIKAAKEDEERIKEKRLAGMSSDIIDIRKELGKDDRGTAKGVFARIISILEEPYTTSASEDGYKLSIGSIGDILSYQKKVADIFLRTAETQQRYDEYKNKYNTKDFTTSTSAISPKFITENAFLVLSNPIGYLSQKNRKKPEELAPKREISTSQLNEVIADINRDLTEINRMIDTKIRSTTISYKK